MKSASVLKRALILGSIVILLVGVVGSIIGYLVAGPSGVASALAGAGLTAFFMGCTTLSILIAERVTRDRPSLVVYFSIVLGMWALKFLIFIVFLFLLRGQEWINAYVFFVSVVVAVVGSLITDVIALAGAQVSSSTGLPAPGPEVAP